MASAYTTLEPGDRFPEGRGYVHSFSERELRDEMYASGLRVEIFCNAEDHGGSRLMRPARLRKPE